MSDELLRRLERESAETSDPAARARHLLERLRRGDLARDRLELAAWVGDAAAALALEGTGWEAPPGETVAWFTGIARFGREAALRAALGAARRLSFARERNGNEIDPVYIVLEKADAWFLAPGEPTVEALRQAFTAAVERPHYGGGFEALVIATLILGPDSFDENLENLAARFANHHMVHLRDVRRWIEREVTPWALGEADPIALRPTREGRRFSAEDDMVRDLVFAPGGTHVLVAACPGHVRVRAFPSGEVVRELPRARREIYAAAFSPDGRAIATGDQDGAIVLWDAATGEALAKLAVSDDQVNDVSFVGSSARLAWCGSGGRARLIELPGGQVVRELEGHVGSVAALDVAPSGELLATAGLDGTARVWDARTGEPRRMLVHGGALDALAWLPDGRRLVTGAGSGRVVVWDALSGEKFRELEGCEGTVYAVAASPRGDLVAACGSIGMLHLWDASTGAVVRELDWSSTVFRLAFSPDGRFLLSGERGGGVRSFDLGAG